MKAQRTTPTVVPDPEPEPEPIERSPETMEQIRARAHELFELRGREEGHDLDDWLQAEAEVTQQRVKTTAA